MIKAIKKFDVAVQNDDNNNQQQQQQQVDCVKRT
jgi:hypothetical protein